RIALPADGDLDLEGGPGSPGTSSPDRAARGIGSSGLRDGAGGALLPGRRVHAAFTGRMAGCSRSPLHVWSHRQEGGPVAARQTGGRRFVRSPRSCRPCGRNGRHLRTLRLHRLLGSPRSGRGGGHVPEQPAVHGAVVSPLEGRRPPFGSSVGSAVVRQRGVRPDGRGSVATG